LKTYILNKLQQLKDSAKTEFDKAGLINHRWLLFDPESSKNLSYIFKSDGRLIISDSGEAIIGKWELLSPMTIMISYDQGHFIFNLYSQIREFLFLSMDGRNGVVTFINQDFVNRIFVSVIELERYLFTLQSSYTSEIFDVSHIDDNDLLEPDYHKAVLQTLQDKVTSIEVGVLSKRLSTEIEKFLNDLFAKYDIGFFQSF
jgi:hypothetical protein